MTVSVQLVISFFSLSMENSENIQFERRSRVFFQCFKKFGFFWSTIGSFVVFYVFYFLREK